MADVKVSGLPSDSSLDGNHYVPINDPSGPTTKRTLLSTLAAFFFNQVNQPAGATGSPVTRANELLGDFVLSGLVITGDAYASTRNASMTSGVLYINGLRISISSVTARTYTASKDTYVDVLSNGDGTGTLVYTEVTNGAASPALAANSLRIGKVVTGASNIAAATSIQQYAVDSLGNAVRPPGAVGPAQITNAAYSAVEVLTGEVWIDGRPIYRKVIRSSVTLSTSTTTNVAHGISGMTSAFELVRFTQGLKIGTGGTNNSTQATVIHREFGGNWAWIIAVDTTNISVSSSFAWGASYFTAVMDYVK